MSYDTTKLTLVSQGLTGPRNWEYRSTDASTGVDLDGYITDATDRGMKVGDYVRVVDTDATPVAATAHIVSAINSDGSADLSDGVSIGVTNSD